MNASKCLLPTTTQPLARKSFTKTQPRPSPSCIPRATPTALLAVPCRSDSGFNPSKCRRGISPRTSTATSRVAAHATPELAPLWRVSESATTSDDLLVSVLFVVAALTLFGLTAGVAYLSFTSWFDDRQERQDRENFENRDKYDEQMNKFRKSGAKKATKEKPVRRATPKGFGKE